MIQTDQSSISYFGNNSIVTPYPVPFYFFTEEALVVTVKDQDDIEDIQALGTDYTVDGEGNPNGGNIVMKWAVPATSSVTIFRNVPITQLTSYEEADAFPAKSHEKALDKLTMICQQNSRLVGTGTGDPTTDIGLAFRLTESSGGINAVVKLNDSMLGIDALGNAVLRTPNEMLGWLGQVGTVWADDAQRVVTRGAFAGQLGVQLNNWSIYIAWSTEPGDWKPFLRFNGLVTSTNGVPGAKAIPAGDIVGTTESQVLTNKTLIAPSITDPTGLDKSDVGLSQCDNTSDMAKPLSNPQAIELSFKQSRDQKGMADGYASLDLSGKVPLNQIPESLLGASVYQGTWNAATNTPAIPPAVPTNKGWYYSVSVAGSTNIDGNSTWAVGDQIISNGTVWERIPNVSAVNSVNGKTGTVVVNKTDVGLSAVDNMSFAQQNSASATLTNKTIRGADNTLEVRLDADVTNNLPVNRLNSGTGAAPDTWWCGDNSWKKPPGTGDVNGPATAVDNDIALFSGVTGKIIKSAGRNLSTYIDGPATAVDGHIPQFNGATGKLLKDGKAAPTGEIVGTTDTQELSGKTLVDSIAKVSPTALPMRVGGMIFSQPNMIANPPSTWLDVWRFVIPVGMMSRVGDMFHVEFEIVYQANANSKSVALQFGQMAAPVSVSNTTPANNFGYHYAANVWRSAGNTGDIFMVNHSWNGAGGGTQNFRHNAPVDYSITHEMKLAINGPAAGDISVLASFVYFYPVI